MMSFLDLTNVEAKKEFVPMTPGNYVLQVDTAEVKDTKANTGKYLQVGFKVTGGEFKGYKLTSRFNTHNANATAQKIGREEIKSLLIAAGKPATALDKPTDLIGMTVMARVGLRKNAETGDLYPEIKAFLPITDAGTTTSGSTTGGFQ